MIVFFFKQKTAYEMRISDWSSDVCSSDLATTEPELESGNALENKSRPTPDLQWCQTCTNGKFACCSSRRWRRLSSGSALPLRQPKKSALWPASSMNLLLRATAACRRSEEHTSELQSLMRISYAVFCLKKKNKYNTIE